MDLTYPARATVRPLARRRLMPALAVCLGVAVVAPAVAAANRYEPANGKIIHGAAVAGSPVSGTNTFLSQTQTPDLGIIHGYVGYKQSIANQLKYLGQVDAAVMISWRMIGSESPGASGGTLTKVANGDLDAYLVQTGKDIAAFNRPVYLRPYWEFNGNWFPWSTYNGSGNKISGNGPEAFRKAWQRGRIIVDGGTRTEINNKLAAAGMTGIKVAGDNFAKGTAAWVWSTAKGGAKYASKGDRTADYYPGNAYVDWVGTSFHQYQNKTVNYWMEQVSNADPLAKTRALYDFGVARGKPFMYSEWAIATKPYGNGDDATYMNDALSWLESHPMAKAHVWFNRDMGSYTHLINNFPKALASYKTHHDKASYVFDWRSIPTGSTGGAAATTPPSTDGGTDTGGSTGDCTTDTSVTVPYSSSTVNETLQFCDPDKTVVAKIRVSSNKISGDVNPKDGKIALTVKVGGTTAALSETTYGYWFSVARPSGSSTMVTISR